MKPPIPLIAARFQNVGGKPCKLNHTRTCFWNHGTGMAAPHDPVKDFGIQPGDVAKHFMAAPNCIAESFTNAL